MKYHRPPLYKQAPIAFSYALQASIQTVSIVLAGREGDAAVSVAPVLTAAPTGLCPGSTQR